MLSWLRKSPVTLPLDEQLARLAENGVGLRPDAQTSDIAGFRDRVTLARGGFAATLCALGAERVDAHGHSRFLSDDVWYLDARCIHGPGAYASVLTRLAQMLPREFPAQNAADSIDTANWRASVSFEIGDVRHHWTQTSMSDWLDETLFVRVNQFIDAQGASVYGGGQGVARHLWQVPLTQHGPQRLIVAATTADGRKLAQVCGVALRTIV